MSEIVVDAFVTLDGVMQAPGGADEDRDGGFEHGGWQVPFTEQAVNDYVEDGIEASAGLLLGRRTYEVFAAHFPTVRDDDPDAAAARRLTAMPKYVASRSLTSLSWQNSTLLGDDVPGAVATLREQPGGEIHVVGSHALLRTLIRHDLVDRYRLMIFPVVLGSGKRLFDGEPVPATFTLTETRATPGGAVYCAYRRAA